MKLGWMICVVVVSLVEFARGKSAYWGLDGDMNVTGDLISGSFFEGASPLFETDQQGSYLKLNGVSDAIRSGEFSASSSGVTFSIYAKNDDPLWNSNSCLIFKPKAFMLSTH
ncbi:MAG: hypothetical protein V4507_12595, partial [Verrucomicrobiota bacterium]